MRIQSGDLRHRVTWKRQDEATTPQSCGESLPTYAEVGTYWAELVPLRGAELWIAAQQVGVRPIRIRMRMIGRIVAGDLIVFEGRSFTVQSARRDLEMNGYLIVDATEGPGAANGGP